MSANHSYIPYFYIIKEVSTELLYAGSRTSSNCNPDEFMKSKGYTTSCKYVNIKLKESSKFEILKIKEFPNDPIAAKLYETRFLKKVDARNNPKFINSHNNEGTSFDSHLRKWYTNGDTEYMFIEGQQPNNWKLGRKHLSSKGKKYYTNGIDSKMFVEGNEPDGWYRGNANTTQENNGMFGVSAHNHSKVLYNNGSDHIYIDKGETPPEGYVKGSTEGFKNKRREAMLGKNNPRYGKKGLKFYNNGIINKLYKEGEQPEGFVLGMIKRGRI